MKENTFAMCGVSNKFYQNPEQYTLDAGDYNQLLKCEIILDVLMKHGVHNWEGFDEAMEAAKKAMK